MFARSGLGNRVHNRPKDIDLWGLNQKWLETLDDKYVVSHRIRISRSIGPNIRLPPTISKAQRRQVEKVLVRALLQTGGKYYPLSRSSSWSSCPEGMTSNDEEWLRKNNFLIPKPDASLNILAGMARNWPDARGVYVSESNKCIAWINDEEHLRLVENQDGCDFTNTFDAAYKRLGQIEAELQKDNTHFLRNQKLGFLLSSPLSTGTGLRASMTLRLELLSKHMPDLRNAARPPISLCAHSCEKDNNMWRISAVSALGLSEREQVLALISTVYDLIRMEQALERGEKEEYSEIYAALGQGVARDKHPSLEKEESPTEPIVDLTEMKAHLTSEEDAAVFIQKKWGEHQEYKVHVQEVKAATYIQTSWKEHEKYKIHVQESNAAIYIQTRWKEHEEYKVVVKENNAAMCIQTRWKEREEYKVHVRDNNAAICIQGRWREREGYKQELMVAVQENNAATIIQTRWRERQEYKVVVQENNAATIIQTSWKERQEYKVYVKEDKAATCIQKKVERTRRN